MMHRNKIWTWFFIVFAWLGFTSFTLPDAKYDNQTLFKIVRSKDPNEIWYTLNLNQDGSLSAENPVNVFWVKKTENHKIEPLTWVQDRYAYGIKVLDAENKDKKGCRFQFVSYEKRTFELKRTPDNIYKVFTDSKNKEIEVTRIFVQIDGGSFWLPSVSYVRLSGVETSTGNQVTEIIIP